MNKRKKGSYEYLKDEKRWQIIKTIGLFAISAAVFLIGYFTTKTKGNLLTIVAVLGCLPASKSAVTMIMVLRIPYCKPETHEKITAVIENLNGFYHLYFTAYDKYFPITHLIVTDNSITAYSDSISVKENEFENHILQLLLKDGIKDVNVKLFTDLEKYLTRISQLREKSETPVLREDVINLLLSVSL